LSGNTLLPQCMNIHFIVCTQGMKGVGVEKEKKGQKNPLLDP